jgi:hypothetical protein
VLLTVSLKVPFELAVLVAGIFSGIASLIQITRLKGTSRIWQRGGRQ